MRSTNNMSEFERRFKRGEAFFWVFFSGVLTFIVVIWLLIGYVGYTAFSDPAGTAKQAGNLVGEFIQGVKEKQ